MSNFGLLLICFVIGHLLKSYRKFPKETPVVLNHFIFTISLPAMILVQFRHLVFNQNAVFPIIMPWVQFALSYAFFLVLGKVLKWPRKEVGALILTAGLGNTSFVGYPMIEAFFGPEWIQIGMLSDQLGSFLILSTWALITASQFTGQSVSCKALIRRVLSFPPIYALVLALMIQPLTIPDFILDVLNRLGSMITPLAMVSVGYQLKLNRQRLRHYMKQLGWGVGFKLIFIPAAFTLASLFLFSLHGKEVQVTLTESAMAPMISAGILAAEAGLDLELASLMIGVGIPLSFVTVPIWVYFFKLWF